MSINTRKLKDGTTKYQLQVSEGRGKKKRTTLDVTDPAVAAEIDRAAAKLKKQHVPDINTNAPIKDLVPHYLDWYQDHRAATSYADCCGVLTKPICRILGQYTPSQINEDVLYYYQKIRKNEHVISRNPQQKRTKLLDRTVSGRTIKKELAYFAGFMRWCSKKKLCDPLPQIEDIPHTPKTKILLNHAEAMQLIESADKKYQLLFKCMYWLGLRFNEARSLMWENIDLSNKKVSVLQKGNTLKELPLTDEIYQMLCMEKPEQAAGLVFPSKRTGSRISDIRKALQSAAKRAGINKKITAHNIRHSIATELIRLGTPTRTVQNLLGHSRIQTTEQYTHVELDMVREALNQLSKKEAT